MSLTPRFVVSQVPLGRWTAGATALAVAGAALLFAPAQSAATNSGEQQRVGVRSAPASAHALIRTIPLTNKGLAAGVGGQSTASASDDTIYVTSNNATLWQINAVTLEVDDSVSVGAYPLGIAVSRDDTVYVVNANDSSLSVVRSSTMTVDRTVTVPNSPQAVALSRVDDTVFISSSGTSRSITMLKSSNLDDSIATSLGSIHGASPWGLAVGSDDSAYIANFFANTIFGFNSATRTVSNAFTGAQGPIGVAVTTDDSVYFTRQTGNALTRFPAGDPSSSVSLTIGRPKGVSLGPDGSPYVAGQAGGDGFITVVNPSTFSIDDSVATGPGAWSSIAVTRSGLAVAVDRDYHNYAVIIADLTPSLVTTSAFAGTTGSLTLGGLPAGVTVDDTTVGSVAFGDDTVVWTRTAGTNTFTGPIPAGSGSVPVVVALNGGNTAFAGTFTYASTPPPPTPSSAPRSASAVAGDGSASVSWAPPASAGSYAVSTYQVVASPGGRTCLTSSLSCEVTRLANGTSYTFTVRALTGAGWSPASEPSNAVTPEAAPRPSVVITGSREGKRIVIVGQTTGFGLGGTLRPWTRFPGQSTFTEGAATILVSTDGTFEWRRKTGRKVSVYVQTSDASVRSNTVTIAPR